MCFASFLSSTHTFPSGGKCLRTFPQLQGATFEYLHFVILCTSSISDWTLLLYILIDIMYFCTTKIKINLIAVEQPSNTSPKEMFENPPKKTFILLIGSVGFPLIIFEKWKWKLNFQNSCVISRCLSQPYDLCVLSCSSVHLCLMEFFLTKHKCRWICH